MANKIRFSTKRLAIDKANTQMVATVAVASFIVVFALVASHALWSQGSYQQRVINKKQDAVSRLKENIKTANQLKDSYGKFNDTSQNIIGGDPKGDGDRDGDNAQLILHALPDRYDFPALTSSIEKILTDRNFKIDSIGGTDDQLAQQSNGSSDSPEPTQIPFSFAVSQANYTSIQDLVQSLQRSIRPFQIDTMNITGGESNMQMTINAHTYYQPAKNLDIKAEVVK